MRAEMRLAARLDVHPRENRLCFERSARIDDQTRQWRYFQQGPKLLAETRHHLCALTEADRNIGPGFLRRLQNARVFERECIRTREKAQGCSGIGRAAAYPCRHGQPFHKMESAEFQALDALGKIARGLENEILIEIASSRGCRPLDRKPKCFALDKAQKVAAAREGDEAFEFMPSVGPAAEDVQSQIDLRGGAFCQNVGQGANWSWSN